MQINGLLVTLAPQSRTECEAIARELAGRSELSIGELNDRWLPVAMEATDDAHARKLHDWISARPGVQFVDVVSVSFDDSERDAAAPHPVQFSALND